VLRDKHLCCRDVVCCCCRVTAYSGWTRDGLFEYDMAVIHLGSSMSKLGKFGISSSNTYSRRRMWTAGYPAEKPSGQMFKASCMVGDSDARNNVSDVHITTAVLCAKPVSLRLTTGNMGRNPPSPMRALAADQAGPWL
jgi:hypothetical protein